MVAVVGQKEFMHCCNLAVRKIGNRRGGGGVIGLRTSMPHAPLLGSVCDNLCNSSGAMLLLLVSHEI
jgi:hypothetical protein